MFSKISRIFMQLASAVLLIMLSPAICSAQMFVKGGTFFMRGNLKYSPGKVVIDTVSVIDAATGAEQFEAREDTSFPAYIAGRKVYDLDEVTTPVIFDEKAESQEEYMLEQMKPILMSTEFYEFGASVRLNLRNLIVDDRGKVVFYEFYGMRSVTADNRVKPLTFPELTAQINKFMTELPPVKPATVDGKNVMAYATLSFHKVKIEIINRAIIYSYDGNVYPE